MPPDEINEEWQRQCENEERMIEKESGGSGMTGINIHPGTCKGCFEHDQFMGMCRRYLAPVILVDYCGERQQTDENREQTGVPPFVPMVAVMGYTQNKEPIINVTTIAKAVRDELKLLQIGGVNINEMAIRTTRDIIKAAEKWRPKVIFVRVEKGE